MVENNSTNLTEDEAELYDRQIRLWGLESQKRLHAAEVLLIGIKGLGAEVCKNLILAGIKSLTILDSGVVTEEDSCYQFLAPTDQIGKSRAEASLERAQALNPLVKVTADTDRVDDKDDDFFTKWSVVIATECTKEQLIRISNICHKSSVKFFCADVFGFYGYTFADLQEHEFAEERTVQKPVVNEVDGKEKFEKTKITVKQSLSFLPLENALDIDWTSEKYKKMLSTMGSSYFIVKVLLKFRSQMGRNPQPATRDEDIEKLKKLRDSELSDMSVPLEKVPDQCFQSVFSQLSPVCAIVGGVLAQEVIKTVSQNGTPHNNMFFFNPENSSGKVVCLGNDV